MRRRADALLFCALLGACSAPQTHSRQQPTIVQNQETPSMTASGENHPLPDSALSSSLPREVLLQILGRSAGDFLRLVEVEPATDDESSFVGWRIQRLTGSSPPAWLDVQEGDIVIAINGMPVERPEDAQRIWEAMRVASEIRIDLTRGDEARIVRIPIQYDDSVTGVSPSDRSPTGTASE